MPSVPSTRCARSSRYEAFVSRLQCQLTRADHTMSVSHPPCTLVSKIILVILTGVFSRTRLLKGKRETVAGAPHGIVIYFVNVKSLFLSSQNCIFQILDFSPFFLFRSFT